MTIDTQWIAKCDTCEERFEDDTEYVLRDDLVHDLKGAGWEHNDDDTHTCRRCLRRIEEDHPYAGPIPNPPPPGF